MPVYAKKLTRPQRIALETYEQISGYEPMGQDDFDAGRLNFREMCDLNEQWLNCMVADASRALDHDA
jgi:hypothetical protein